MKIKFICLIPFLLLFGCSSLKIIQNDVSQEYIEKEFGKDTRISVEELSKSDFNLIKNEGRKYISANKALTKIEKEFLILILDNLQYKNNTYFVLKLDSKRAYKDKEIDFKFDLIDNDNNSLVSSTQKGLINTSESTGQLYHYYWLIETITPITKDYFNKNDTPIYLKIIFPKGKIIKYEIII